MSNPYRPPSGGARGRPHPDGTLVLVLGILGLVLCPVAAVPGLLRGTRALREIDAQPGGCTNRSSVVVGRVLSIASLVIWALIISLYLVALAVPGPTTT
ncbi:hypothetical protein GCM10009616_29880 [Microlunatus lacustris]